MIVARVKRLNQKGFGAIETVLVIVLIVAIAGVGYYIYHSTEDKNTESVSSLVTPPANSSPAASPAATTSSDSNANLNNELSSVNSSLNQSTSDLASANNGINDQSTFTSY